MDSKKEEVSTGLNVEKRTFTWTIKNFDKIRQSDELIREQKFRFKAGELIGLETEWRAFLTIDEKGEGEGSDDSENWIGIFLSCTKRPKGINQVNVIGQFSIVSTNKQPVKRFGTLETKSMKNFVGTESTWGFAKCIRKDGNVKDLPIIDGCLVVEMEFYLYAPTPPPALLTRTYHGTVAFVEKQFELVFLRKLQSDLEGLHDSSSQASDVKVKIVSKDKKEFAVNGGVLSVRSPVFERMLETKMKEARTGVIPIDDLSSKTISVLLRYIYSGTLHEDWSKPDVIVQLVYASAKYQLLELQEFLGNVLGMVCSKENAGQLLNLAGKLGMKKAVEDVLERIKKDFTNFDDMLAVISSGCELNFS